MTGIIDAARSEQIDKKRTGDRNADDGRGFDLSGFCDVQQVNCQKERDEVITKAERRVVLNVGDNSQGNQGGDSDHADDMQHDQFALLVENLADLVTDRKYPRQIVSNFFSGIAHGDAYCSVINANKI